MYSFMLALATHASPLYFSDSLADNLLLQVLIVLTVSHFYLVATGSLKMRGADLECL